MFLFSSNRRLKVGLIRTVYGVRRCSCCKSRIKVNCTVLTDSLIHKLRERDTEAFEVLYSDFKTRLYKYFLVKTGYSYDLSSDLLHETFASAIDSSHTLKPGTNIAAWLFTIASRRYCDHLRRHYKSNEISLPDDYIFTADENTEKDFSKKEEIAVLYCALERVKCRYREILVMKYFEEMSDREISDKIGKSVKAVESLLVRARAAMKKQLSEHRDFSGGDI
jgi:RNA polymerase sigma-70 factor (ECF subfamily)